MSNFGSGYAPGSLTSHRPSSTESPPQPYVPEARLVHLYYANFHQAHPILVPAAFYNRQENPDYLHQVVRFIGSHYSKVLSGDDFLEQTTLLLSRDERSPTMVQALLLFSIMMSARNNRNEAVLAMSRAVSLALDLGMYRADFALRFSDGYEMQKESLRRTWWELFMWEIYLALPDCKLTLRCSDVVSEAYLPCEEAAYTSSALQPMPTPQTFSAFRARLFTLEGDSDDNSDTKQQKKNHCPFSSYSYRIEAFHILARVMVLNTVHETHPDHLQSIVNMIVSWSHLLPVEKVDVVDKYGNIDEMLFQAQFIIHYASALLHLPRSNLRPKFPGFPSTICPQTPIRLSPSLTRHIHDVKAIEASKELSNLLSVHSKPHGYSPSMIPGAVLSGLVQLAAADFHASECFEHHQNRAILVLATLSILKMQWMTAREAYCHVKATAAANLSPAATWATASSSVSEPATLTQSAQAQRPPPEAYTNLETRLYDDSNADAEFPPANAMETVMSASNMDPMDRIFMAGLLSPHIDQTCGEPLALNQFANFD
ncbi:hypothetical protein V2A60_003495 [Cordyceps javanica]|uniref:C6 transcription factor n=1 Tax=Cordyceps javanica TaxID=43265 RepID=A0A545V2X9_9HYPO|nr:C6 transcription factor [Cordyceps javanica]TQW07351.1 C6 transcription factor [Cordyceps javanica]